VKLLLFTITILALSFNWLAIYLSEKFKLLDVPDSRKHHSGAIPLTGGIGIFLTVLSGTYILGIEPYTYHMLFIASVVFFIGVYDDRNTLSATWRLIIQYGSGIALATYGGITIREAGNLLALGDIPLLILAVPLTALSVAGLSNAYNMIDGIDGLAASTILVPLLVLGGLAEAHSHAMAPALILLVIPLCIFLLFNLGPNNRLLPKIFLGDNGSTTMGFMVAASLIYFSQGEQALIRPVTALWLVTLPLMDMLATMLRRARSGRKIMDADRSHLHHTLMDLGLSAHKTLVVLVVYAIACALLGLALENLPESLSLLAYFLLFIAHCIFVLLFDRQRRAREQASTSQ
jgi:UDP-GlcNAc:undecaprenyl-phosphate GlcNAc-1-phosphate transferase